MSEFIPSKHESHDERHEVIHQKEENLLNKNPEISPKEEQANKIEEARAKAETIYENRNEKNILEKYEHNYESKDNKDHQQPPASNQLKNITLNNELRHIQRRLSGVDKLGSKIIHQKIVRNVSEVTSKSIARSSGLLGGGLLAFIGTGSYYLFTKHVGINYNYFIFLLLFVIGFVLGIFLELTIWTFRTTKK